MGLGTGPHIGVHTVRPNMQGHVQSWAAYKTYRAAYKMYRGRIQNVQGPHIKQSTVHNHANAKGRTQGHTQGHVRSRAQARAQFSMLGYMQAREQFSIRGHTQGSVQGRVRGHVRAHTQHRPVFFSFARLYNHDVCLTHI